MKKSSSYKHNIVSKTFSENSANYEGNKLTECLQYFFSMIVAVSTESVRPVHW